MKHNSAINAIRRDFLSLPLTMIIFLGSVITSANLAVNLYFAKILMNNSALQNIVIWGLYFLFYWGSIYAQKERRKHENR